jgi:hypothetical protein
MLLLGWFCVLIGLARVHTVLALMASAGMWAVANFNGLNLPSYPDSFGWYFNPFAWQLIFSLGVLAGLAHRRGAPIPRSRWLCLAATAYLLFAFLLVAPWTQIPGWQDQVLLPRDLIGPVSKQNLSPWRLANVLALAYLIAIVIPASASWLRHPCLSWVTNLGRNGLEVFCAGTVLSLVGFVVLVEVDRGMVTQLAVNFGGLLTMGLTAWWAGKRRQSTTSHNSSRQTVPSQAPRRIRSAKRSAGARTLLRPPAGSTAHRADSAGSPRSARALRPSSSRSRR